MDPTFLIGMPAVILNAKQCSDSINLSSTYSHLFPFFFHYHRVVREKKKPPGCPVSADLWLLWVTVILFLPNFKSFGFWTSPFLHETICFPRKGPGKKCSPCPAFQLLGRRRLLQYFKASLKLRNINTGANPRNAAESLSKGNHFSLILLC